MQQNVVLIGAGSANFGLGTLGDILKSKVFAGSCVTLHDINPAALKRVEDVGRAYIDANHLPFQLKATTNRREALQGATFVIISIEVGSRFKLWDQDWKVPMQYGIRQVYGENGGPGGLFHALRIIPPILEICGDIMQVCPDAYVFNFSNPMSRICTAVLRKYPDLKFTGLCHEIASLPEHLPQILDTPLENLHFRAGGLNHFSVLLEVCYKDTGRDAYPDVHAKAPAYFARLPGLMERIAHEIDPSIPLIHHGDRWSERELFKVILEKFGYMPITTDSHFGEYVQWAHDSVDHEGILQFYETYQVWCAEKISDSRIEGTQEGWTEMTIMEGLLTGSGHEEPAVNIMNKGLIENLPADIAVEVPAVIDQSGIHGIRLGRLPAAIGGLLNNQYAVHDLTCEAVFTGSRRAALQALLLDPVVHSVKAAEQTLDTILELQKQYLGYLH